MTPHLHLGLAAPTKVLRIFVPTGLVVVLALVGLVLLAEDLRQRLAPSTARRTSWQHLNAMPRRNGRGPDLRAVLGLALVLTAFLTALLLAFGGGVAHGLPGLLLLAAIALAALAAAGSPVAVALIARAESARVEHGREQERQRVAAHLHDSVLQTFALVRRQSHDPEAVERLARRQEHELRGWMAGHHTLGAESLAGALHDAIAETHDEYGIHVTVSITGDQPLDEQSTALAEAAREALRNAAKHAAGATVYLYAHIRPADAEVFIRDTGPGFDLGRVPLERRGVRNAIIARMNAVGGIAHIESEARSGTEVTLRIRSPLKR